MKEPKNQHQLVLWYLLNMNGFSLRDVINDSMFFKFQTRLSELEAFKAGKESSKPEDVTRLKQELHKAKKELKELWKTIEDPEAFADLVAGL